MAGASFDLDMNALTRVVEGMTERMNDMQLLAEDVGELLVSSTLERFERGVDPEGNAWPVSIRAAREGGKTLVDKGASGGLMGSILYEASPTMVIVGSDKIYAAIHQYGGQAGRGRKVTIPKRSYLGINDADRDEIKGMMLDHLNGK